MSSWKLWAAAGAVALLAQPASATIIGVSPTGGGTGVNIVNNGCDDEIDGPANVIRGCLNGGAVASATPVDFINTYEPIEFGGGGQATVLAADGLAQWLTIDPSFDLGRLIVDVNAIADGWIKFEDNIGAWATLLALDDKGSNFFDITFYPDAAFLKMSTFSDAAGTTAAQLIENTKQWRVEISEEECPDCVPTPTAIPEPTSLFLLGSGVLGLSLLRRRRRQRA